jgi:hypothetical protein
VKGLAGAVVALVILAFLLVVLFAGQTCSGHVGSIDWSVTIPSLPSPVVASPSPS